MQLNRDEIATLKRGEVLECEVPDLGARCVVMRSDEYLKLNRNSADLPMEVVTKLVDRAMSEDDVDDPLLAGYQRFGR
jgi:hypothetical protein